MTPETKMLAVNALILKSTDQTTEQSTLARPRSAVGGFFNIQHGRPATEEIHPLYVSRYVINHIVRGETWQHLN